MIQNGYNRPGDSLKKKLTEFDDRLNMENK